MRRKLMLIFVLYVCSLCSIEQKLQNLSESLQLFNDTIPWIPKKYFLVKSIWTTEGRNTFSIKFEPANTDYGWHFIYTDIMKLLMRHLLDSKDYSSTIKVAFTTNQFNPGKSLSYDIQGVFNFSKKSMEAAKEIVGRLTTLILYQEYMHPGSFARQDFITGFSLTEDQKTRWQRAQQEIAKIFREEKLKLQGKTYITGSSVRVH